MASISTAIRLNDQMTAPIKNITNAMNMMLSAWNSLDSATSGGLDADGVEEVRSELNKATQALDQMGDEQDQFNRKVNQGQDAVIGLASKIAGMAAGIGFAKIAKDAIEFASDLTEVQNVVDVTFRENSAVVDEWAKTTLESFGLNELSAKQYAGTMGAMLKSSGLTGDAVGDMSMKITELAGDMASFYNLDSEEAFTKIRSGISGETEPLKQLGINMSVANLEAYAMSQGITKAYDKMSQAEQVTLRYNYLLQATADAQGDFARTSDSFANQQKLLSENFQAFTGQLATYVLPILAQLFQVLNSGLKFLSDNIEVVLPLLAGGAGIIATMVIFTHTAQIAAAATKVWTATQAAFNAVMSMNPIAWVIIAIIALIAVVVAVANHIAKLGGTATTTFGVIAGGINVVLQFFVNLWEVIKSVCSNIPIAFSNAWIGAKAGLNTFISSVLNGIISIGEALNKLPFVNFDMSGLRSAADSYAQKAADLNATKGSYNSIQGFESGWVSEAYAAGAAWGDNLQNKISNAVSNGITDSGLTDDTSSIATSAGSAADSLDVTKEDLKYLRDLAEQEAVNRFTTAEVKVELGGVTNNVNSNMDLDGVVDYLTTGVQEAMERIAEGVH